MSKVHPQQLVQLVRWLRDHGAHSKSGVSWFRSDGPRIDWNGKFETPETLVLFAFSDVPWWFPVSLPLKSSHWAFQREQHSSRCSRCQGLDISHRGTSHRKDPKPLWVAWQQGLYPMNCHVGNPGIIFGNWLVLTYFAFRPRVILRLTNMVNGDEWCHGWRHGSPINFLQKPGSNKTKTKPCRFRVDNLSTAVYVAFCR